MTENLDCRMSNLNQGQLGIRSLNLVLKRWTSY